METLREIIPFLAPNARLDLKAATLTHILNLTGSDEGRKLLLQCDEIVRAVAKLTEDTAETVAKDSVLCLVNLSADEEGAKALLDNIPNLVECCVVNILNPDAALADPWSMILSNISRPESLAERVYIDCESKIDNLVSAFVNTNFNTKKCHLNYLAPIFSNLTQVSQARNQFCRNTEILSRLLPFVSYEDSVVRKGGVIGVLKNICFNTKLHDFLLTEIDVLPMILLPLTGPEDFTEEENEMFPIDLQYLGPDKKRESDPDIRRMLLESLAQLCATRKAREFLRSKGTYEILRELHRFECSDAGDKLTLRACENVVDILIRTEDEIGEDDLKSLEIPNNVLDKINQME